MVTYDNEANKPHNAEKNGRPTGILSDVIGSKEGLKKISRKFQKNSRK